MKTQVLLFTMFLTLVGASGALRSEEGYTFIDLVPLANFKINAVKKYPTGHVRLKGVPFVLPAARDALQTQGQFAPGPTSFAIPASVHRPKVVYILLSGGYVKEQFKGQPVGQVILKFADSKAEAKPLTYPITAWETIRETWAYNTNIQQPDSRGNPKLLNVYAEPQSRAGKPATAFLDMYVIDLDAEAVTSDLAEIQILDTSRETVGDICPSLIVAGITVKHE
jgi:hypothetical protein